MAELGKYDAVHERWVTSQPYQVGVLLSSSNASTWTPHQDRDLTFRLLGARFTATIVTKTGDYSDVTVIDADGNEFAWSEVSHISDDEDFLDMKALSEGVDRSDMLVFFRSLK